MRLLHLAYFAALCAPHLSAQNTTWFFHADSVQVSITIATTSDSIFIEHVIVNQSARPVYIPVWRKTGLPRVNPSLDSTHFIYAAGVTSGLLEYGGQIALQAILPRSSIQSRVASYKAHNIKPIDVAVTFDLLVQIDKTRVKSIDQRPLMDKETYLAACERVACSLRWPQCP